MKKIICIDPGHGGQDPGAIGNGGVQEKDLALDTALKLEQLLRSEGYYPVLTRYDDHYIKLGHRAQIANLLQADLFLSIHFNAAANQEAQGSEVLYYPSNESKVLAGIINHELSSLGRKDRGIKARPNLAVLNSTTMPACLIEGGFLSNLAEEEIITSKSYRCGLAQAIAVGIRNYPLD